MSLKVTCPSCKTTQSVNSPLPQPGSTIQCVNCATKISMTYPVGVIDKLRAKGYTFAGEGATETPTPPTISPSKDTEKKSLTLDKTVAVQKPHGTEKPSTKSISPKTEQESADSSPKTKSAATSTAPPPKKKRSWLQIIFSMGILGILLGVGSVFAIFNYYSNQVPSVEELREYKPPTVTTLYDRNGKLLGEIYEKRRYVREYKDFPPHLVNSFLAAEDANFWEHHGIDYIGIVRAVVRNALKGKKAQGASTITQQVAKNFLLSSEKTYTRKIKEVILAQRIEETFSKEHILFLYLNQIYLGSGAYGVEAAARVYFNKHVEELTLAESAIIAGLPQRPADYSPHIHWEKARMRQEYVLQQLLDKKFIDQATYDDALQTKVRVYKEENPFLTQAPHYTEYVRRYLVDTYGFDKVYNDGLDVITACDLDLQKVAQESVYENVAKASRSQGYEGPIKTIQANEIPKFIEEQENLLREQSTPPGLIIAEQTEKEAGYFPKPAKSSLHEKQIYDAVVTEVDKKHAFVQIGVHKVIIPLSWSKWGYKPDPERSFKKRYISVMTDMLHVGDVIKVRVETLDAQSEDNLKGYAPIKNITIPAGQVWKEPGLEGALFSYRVTNSSPETFDQGAVLSMVGGYDFAKSEYNRATQAQRQVGSTFKPIVYAQAIASKNFTVASTLVDGPLVYQTIGDKVWKPGNYGEDYLGEITLREALQKSRNVCTIRVLDKVSLESIFQLAGPGMLIGYDNPVRQRRHIPLSESCENGISENSPVAGMQWCTTTDASTCPVVRSEQQYFTRRNAAGEATDTTFDLPKTCLDTPFEQNGEKWCHSCDVNLRVCDWLPITKIPEKEPCVDARLVKDTIMCRTCDLSMGLGSSSLTMVELVRAYSVFATYGSLVEPYFIESVKDRDATIIEKHEPIEPKPVLNSSVAGIANWLLVQVATGGTAAKSNQLKLHVAGKTGTTNDFFDAWFVGYNPDILAATWVGYDTPKSMGVSFTGGDISLPIWMDFMKEAVPKDKNPDFPPIPGVTWAKINLKNGLLASDGFPMPMLPGTEPNNIIGSSTQKTVEDLLIDGDF